jgi:uncharacterized repeat protein (TIGR03837 family)
LQRKLPNAPVRLFCDNPITLRHIAPKLDPVAFEQIIDGIVVFNCSNPASEHLLSITPACVVVEILGCELPQILIPAINKHTRIIINLEYLTAEPWAAEYHKLTSPLPGLKPEKYFYMPGFVSGTGGVLIDTGMVKRSADIRTSRTDLLRSFIPAPLYDWAMATEAGLKPVIGTFFTYETDFSGLVKALMDSDRAFLILLCGEKTCKSFSATVPDVSPDTAIYAFGSSRVFPVPWLSQTEYENLMLCADFNVVRGEDSLVRAVQCGVPFLWQAYPQKNESHKEKVDAFCETFTPWFNDDVLSETYKKYMTALNATDAKTGYRGGTFDFAGFLNRFQAFSKGSAEFALHCIEEKNLVNNFLSFINNKLFEEHE